MRFTKLGASALVAISLISMDTHASPINRKFHPVVNDDPQNAHLNVQTPGADINQTLSINEEPGPDGQVIPAGETKVASCAGRDVNGDIDLSAAGSCTSSTASAPVAARASIAQPTIGQVLSPSTRAPAIRVPSVTAASVAPARNTNASTAPTTHAVEAARSAAPVPTYRTESARAAVSKLPTKQPASAARTNVANQVFAPMQWLEIGLAAAALLALGLGLLLRMGLADLLRMRRERHTDEERPALDAARIVLD